MTDKQEGGPISVSVIIPTSCAERRAALIRRAIDSVVTQRDVDIELIIVVNGSEVSEDLYEELCRLDTATTARLEIGSLPAAQRFGRDLVSKPFFTLLDDDDELLPGALKVRSDALHEDPAADVVVTNGYLTYDGREDELHVDNFGYARSDPLTALMQKNWIVSCGALFRTNSIPLDCFDGKTKYREWTLLAVTFLLMNRNVKFLDIPTFRKHEELQDSLSKTEAYRKSGIAFLNYLLTLPLPGPTENEVKRKLGSSYHVRSDSSRQNGDWKSAWRYHLQSLRFPGRARYLLYTRKLLLPITRSHKSWMPLE